MGLKPEFRVIANALDITAIIRARLVSLSVTDESGLQSDVAEIVLADHDARQRIAIPPTGAELEIFMGYDGAAERMGLYVVDEVEIAGPPDMLRISAKAASHENTPGGQVLVQTHKTRSFAPPLTLGDLTAIIAQDHGLQPAVAASLANIQLPHIDQVAESDMNLITRIARTYDAIAKPGGGKLIVAKRGESKTVSGQALPSVTVTPDLVTSWRVNISKRRPAGRVIAVWRDVDAAQDVEEAMGDGDPIVRLRHSHPDRAAAQSAAAAEYSKRTSGERLLSLSMPGDPSLVADGKLTLQGFRDGAAGQWLVTRVQHTIDSAGYVVNLTASLPNE
mgnify:CR=1 FL=1